MRGEVPMEFVLWMQGISTSTNTTLQPLKFLLDTKLKSASIQSDSEHLDWWPNMRPQIFSPLFQSPQPPSAFWLRPCFRQCLTIDDCQHTVTVITCQFHAGYDSFRRHFSASATTQRTQSPTNNSGSSSSSLSCFKAKSKCQNLTTLKITTCPCLFLCFAILDTIKYVHWTCQVLFRRRASLWHLWSKQVTHNKMQQLSTEQNGKTKTLCSEIFSTNRFNALLPKFAFGVNACSIVFRCHAAKRHDIDG